MIVHVGGAKAAGSLLFALSIAASTATARLGPALAASGSAAKAALFEPKPAEVEANADEAEALFPAAASERRRLVSARDAATAPGARAADDSLADALQHAALVSDRLGAGKADARFVPDAVATIVNHLRDRADGISLLSNDATVAEGQALLGRASAELTRDSEALLSRSTEGSPRR